MKEFLLGSSFRMKVLMLNSSICQRHFPSLIFNIILFIRYESRFTSSIAFIFCSVQTIFNGCWRNACSWCNWSYCRPSVLIEIRIPVGFFIVLRWHLFCYCKVISKNRQKSISRFEYLSNSEWRTYWYYLNQTDTTHFRDANLIWICLRLFW